MITNFNISRNGLYLAWENKTKLCKVSLSNKKVQFSLCYLAQSLTPSCVSQFWFFENTFGVTLVGATWRNVSQRGVRLRAVLVRPESDSTLCYSAQSQWQVFVMNTFVPDKRYMINIYSTSFLLILSNFWYIPPPIHSQFPSSPSNQWLCAVLVSMRSRTPRSFSQHGVFLLLFDISEWSSLFCEYLREN